MGTKHIPIVSEYQSSISIHQLMIHIKHQPDAVQVDVDKIMFFIQAKMIKCSQKSVKIVQLFWNLHTLKCKENIYPEYVNINRQPVATQLTTDIRHQSDTVLVDI